MARYDFSRMSVLIVEDSKFMQSLLLGVMKALGVERITTCDNGEEAIQIMTPIGDKTQPMVGMTGIDMVLCDMFMPIVDGSMFLRWIRRSEKSADRFLPFIMISAAADRDVLFACRDAGMDEFLAKPFSASGVAARIIAAIENPRPYIYCPTYFGPDRRRKKMPADEERRKITEAEIETLYSGKDMSKLKNSKKRVWIFKMPKQLKNKLSTGSAGKDEPPFDPAMIEMAETKIADMEGDYADWVKDSIDEMSQAHHRTVEDPSAADQHLETINRIALELRGQGGIFGYPLMTKFGKSLYESTRAGTSLSTQLLDLIDAHISLIKVVMNQKIKGDGGAIGKELLGSLAEAKKKHANVTTD